MNKEQFEDRCRSLQNDRALAAAALFWAGCPESLIECHSCVIRYRMREHEIEQSLMEAWDPRHDQMFCYFEDAELWEVYWGGYRYGIALEDLAEPKDALRIIAHIAQKTWQHTTPQRIALLIKDMEIRRGWKPQSPVFQVELA